MLLIWNYKVAKLINWQNLLVLLLNFFFQFLNKNKKTCFKTVSNLYFYIIFLQIVHLFPLPLTVKYKDLKPSWCRQDEPAKPPGLTPIEQRRYQPKAYLLADLHSHRRWRRTVWDSDPSAPTSNSWRQTVASCGASLAPVWRESLQGCPTGPASQGSPPATFPEWPRPTGSYAEGWVWRWRRTWTWQTPRLRCPACPAAGPGGKSPFACELEKNDRGKFFPQWNRNFFFINWTIIWQNFCFCLNNAKYLQNTLLK